MKKCLREYAKRAQAINLATSSVIQALISLLVLFNVAQFTPEQTAGVMTLVGAVLALMTVLVTRPNERRDDENR